MRSLIFLARQQGMGESTYQLTDRLHDGRTARVTAECIASTIAGWLAELGAGSPFVEDLSRAVRNGDWVHAHAIAEALSVDVTVAA